MEFSPRRPVSPANSSPSLYSRCHTNYDPSSPATSMASIANPVTTRSRLASRLQHLANMPEESEYGDYENPHEEDEPPIILKGPRITKYSELPSDEDVWEERGKRNQSTNGGVGLGLHFGGFGLTVMNGISPSTSTESGLSAGTRKLGITNFLGGNGKDKDKYREYPPPPSHSDQSLLSSMQSTASEERSLVVTPQTHTHGSTYTYDHSNISHNSPLPVRHANSTNSSHDDVDQTPHFPQSSLVPDHPNSTPHQTSKPLTSSSRVDPANLQPSLFTLSPNPCAGAWKATDRPLLSSGSPGFGLISLEVAQERERERASHKNVFHITKEIQGKPGGGGSFGGLKAKYKSVKMAATGGDSSQYDSSMGGSPPRLKGKKSLIKLWKTHTSGNSSATGSSGGHAISLGGGNSTKMALKIGEPMPMSMAPPLPTIPASIIHDGNSASTEGNNNENTPRTSLWSGSDDIPPVWPKPAENSSLNIDKNHLGLGPKLELRPVSMTFTNGLPSDYLAIVNDNEQEGDNGTGGISPSSTLAVGGGWDSRPNSISLSIGSEYSRPSGEMERGSSISGDNTSFRNQREGSATSSLGLGVGNLSGSTAVESVLSDGNRSRSASASTYASGNSGSYLGVNGKSSTRAEKTISETGSGGDIDPIIAHLHLQLSNARKAWRVQLSELSSQMRELRDELDLARSEKHCRDIGCTRCHCGCQRAPSNVMNRNNRTPYTSSNSRTASDAAGDGGQETLMDLVAGMRRNPSEEEGEYSNGYGPGKKSVMDRGRVKTGTAGARGVFGRGSLYEWE